MNVVEVIERDALVVDRPVIEVLSESLQGPQGIQGIQGPVGPGIPLTRTVNGHALSSDVVITVTDLTQDATHRFVTDTEKATWNGKQDALGYVPANLAGAAFTGAVTVPNRTLGDNSANAANTAFVAAAIANIVNSAPAVLDTLGELSAALGNDQNFATTVSNAIGLKAPLASPALTGTPTAPTAAAGDNSTKIATTAFALANIAVGATISGANTQNRVLYVDVNHQLATFTGLNFDGGSLTVPGATTFSAFSGGSQMNLSTSGPSFIGAGGAVMIAYAAAGGQWLQDSAAGDTCYRHISGKMLFGNDSATNALLTIAANQATFRAVSATKIPVTIVAAAAQSANLQEWQNSAGTPQLAVDANGKIVGKRTAGQVGIDMSTADNYIDCRVFRNPLAEMHIGYGGGGVTYLYGGAGNAAVVMSSTQTLIGGGGTLTLAANIAANTYLTLLTNSAVWRPLLVKGFASQTANLSEWQNSTGNKLFAINGSGVPVVKVNSAPADADLSANECGWWFDSTNGAAKAMFKGKTANGTVVSGSVSLT